MVSESHTIVSSNLFRTLNLKIYGHFGPAIILFPTHSDSFLENETNGLLDPISHLLKKGKFRIFAIDSINSECWLNNEKSNDERSNNHLAYNNFLIEELLPEIYAHCGGPVPLFTCGASMGAYHAANTYFRRPDIFHGVIAMSGFYNLDKITNNYFDSNCYFNSPTHYLPNLHDSYWLSFLMSKKHVHLLCGNGPGENPFDTYFLHDILDSKNIPHQLDIWGEEWGHNWETWKKMLLKVLENKF